MNDERYPSKANEFLLFLNITLLLVCIGFILKSGLFLSAKEKEFHFPDETDEQFADFAQTFSEVYNIIRDKYLEVDQLKAQDLYEGAINGMFNQLDPHSQYMGSDHFSQLSKDTEGKFSGIGIHIGNPNNILTVISPIPGGPSARAGLMPMDRIVKIEGESTENISLPEAIRKLTGPPGTKVKIEIWREGESEPLEFEITRDVIKIDSVYWKIIDKDVGYARLAKFSANTARDLKKALIEFKKQGCGGMILDLRFNTGGLLNEAMEVSELFLDKGKLIVETRGRDVTQNSSRRAESNAVFSRPMIVLVNKGSASASEIVAGALQDNKRALIIGPKGKTTFGKGSVQSIERLNHCFERDENNNLLPAAVRITTAKYYTPSGRSIHGDGIKPDLEVELPPGHELELSRGHLLGDPLAEAQPAEEQEDGPADEEQEQDLPELNELPDLAPPDAPETDTPETPDAPDAPETDTPDAPDAAPQSEQPQPDAETAPQNPEQPDSEETPKTKEPEFYKRILDRVNARKSDKKEEPFQDIQLNEAVKYLRVMIFSELAKAA